MVLPTQTELKRRIRALAAWADEEQEDLATAVGVKYPTFKGYFAASKPGPPLEIAIALADHLGAPRDFVLYGWDMRPAAADLPAAVEARFQEMERRLRDAGA